MGCGGDDKPVQLSKKALAEPMAEPTPAKIEARVKKAGDFVLRYAENHGGELPKVESVKELRELLRPEFGSDPEFDDTFVGYTGKVFLNYNFAIQGKKLADIPQKKQTALMWDPNHFEKLGKCYVYLDGSTGWHMQLPQIAGG